MDAGRLAARARALCRAVVGGNDAVPELLALVADAVGAVSLELASVDASPPSARPVAREAVLVVERSPEQLTLLTMRHPERDFTGDELAAVALVATALGASIRAREALRELEAVAGGRGAAGVTPRQGQVAELVAAGLTNDEVARRLTISSRTVRKHLGLLFERTGARSRTELAVLWTDAAGSGLPLRAAR